MRSIAMIPVTAYMAALLLANVASGATVVTAENAAPANLSSYFNVGAGMAIDPPAPDPFDNRLVQTFVATISGRPTTASLIATRSPGTTAPLIIDVATLNGNEVFEILASGSLGPDAFGGDEPDPLQFNGVVNLSASSALVAGEEYALVFRSETPDANYRIYGASDNHYDEGQALRSQNSPMFRPLSSGADLFFQVTVDPVPEPASFLLFVASGAMLHRRVRRRLI